MTLEDVKKRTQLARQAGWTVGEADYGFTTYARKPDGEAALVLTEVFREDADGYIGYKMISIPFLEDFISGKEKW
jgi:hypothetical protein